MGTCQSHQYGTGGGQKIAASMGVFLLTSLPFDPRVVQGGEAGRCWNLPTEAILARPWGGCWMKWRSA